MQFLHMTAGERIDLSDLQYAALDSQLGTLQAMPRAMLTAPQKQQAWIMRGFVLSNPTGQVVTVGAGSAILGMRTGAQVTPGTVFSAQDSVSVDLTSYSAATYNVYVRFVFAPTDMDTRTFWQAGGTGQEYAATVPTRFTGEVEVAVSQALPGAEYLQIGTVTVPSMAFVDMRPLYFEGRVDQATASGWGSGTDRSDDRAANGIGDLQTALSAVRQSLEDIKGSGLVRWYSAFVAGQTIGYAGQAVMGRTSWADANFYAQGDANRPRINWAADGAHMAYTRSTGLMAITGAPLGAAAGSVSTAFGFRSGADEAIIRASFYRASTLTGPDAVDASFSRNPPGQGAGALTFYGGNGMMGAAGVGLGFGGGRIAPTMFVGSSAVAIGATSASNLVSTEGVLLQFPVATGNASYLSFTDGSSPYFSLGFANYLRGGTSQLAYISLGVPLLFQQAGNTQGALKNGNWQFGPGSGLTSTAGINDATVNIVNAPSNGFASNPALVINNNNTLVGQTTPFDAQIGMGVGGVVYTRIFQSPTVFRLLDTLNNFNILAYNSTTKALTTSSSLQAGSFTATNNSTTAFAFNPAVSHTNMISGIHGRVMLGTQQQGTLLSYLGVASSGTAAIINVPIVATQGSQIVFYSAEVLLQTNSTVTLTAYWVRTDMFARQDFQVGTPVTVTSSGSTNTRNVVFSGPLGLETSNPEMCWTLSIQATVPGGSFFIELHYVRVNFSTPSLNPQRQ